MNENFCLCKCFTELYFFYWLLLIVPLTILIAVPFVFSRSWTSLSGVNSNCLAYKTLFKITHRCKTLKINLINSLLCWSVTLLMFSANLALFKSENRLAVLILILVSVSLKAKDWSSWILTECTLSYKIVKYCILSEVCMLISTVSPQMGCIKSIRGWFTHPQIYWQEFVK